MSDLETRILDLAVRRGLLDSADLDALTLEEDTLGSQQWGPRITSLLRSGRLDQQGLQALMGDLFHGSTESRAPEGSDDTLILPQGLTWQGYQDLQLIGVGGQALIYKARDMQLDRWVALKFPIHDRPQRVAHMLREARAQAQLDHPNVLKVLEVGEHQGKPFIAMHYVEGGNLAENYVRFSIETRVRLMKAVAEGLQEAHSHGLLHLDLKPGNILVDTTHPEEPWPYLTDFGLVRLEDYGGRVLAERLPAFGTAPFSSPEQMARDLAHLDRRSDIYSLGATLYSVLSGHTPFDSRDPLDILGMDPVPLRARDPMLPKDLEAIVAKCLRSAPEERYGTAKAVADDLQRFLDGVPVHARRPSPAYRLAKWVRRNRSLAAMTVIAILLFTGFGTWAILAARRQALQVRLANKYGRDVQSMEQLLRLAHLSRKHNRRPAVTNARETMAAIEQEMKALGPGAMGPGSYALGMGHLALSDWDAARRHLETAWQAGFHSPACAQARGEVLTHFFMKANPRLNLIADPAQREVERKRLESTLREPALACFEIARAAGLETAYQEAMEAYLARDIERALRCAQTAFEQTRWRYEARFLTADLLMEQAIPLRAAGDIAGAQRKCDESLKVLEPVTDIAPSDPASWIKIGLLYFNMAFDRRQEPQWLERALASFATAVEVDPGFGESYGYLSMAQGAAADAVEVQGGDPMPLLNLCVANGEMSQSLTPPGQVNTHLGEAYGWRAGALLKRGLDAIPDLDRAIANLRQAIDLGNHEHVTYTLLLTVSKWRGEAAFQVGADPVPYLEQAIGWARKNTQFDASNLQRQKVFMERRLDLLDMQFRLKQTPKAGVIEALVQEAQAILERTAKENRFKAELRVVLGRALRLRAREAFHTGKPFEADFEQALQLTRKAVEQDPKEPAFQAELAKACLEAGGCQFQLNLPCDAILKRGLAEARKYQRMVPGRADAAGMPLVAESFLARAQRQPQDVARSEARLKQRLAEHPREAAPLKALLALQGD
ncbi:serine/threonine-protein kinase [Geothrix sp. PMB-07]|uniref:serine/threonine-protein kinase n=1 Tax=Geothrix sp. PMB-07 TaxID=3068640 RepID=UPI002741F821|nr:serine/threonine-protein kinase [Geothrix sp. PMB-07]WLT31000.1 protein kinase [Geothrix sp. PMB-07]